MSAIALLPALAHGWGAEGHRVVAKLAAARLTPVAQAGASSLLNAGETLADASTWADTVKFTTRPDTRDWHYVDIPRSAQHYDAARDCASDDCLLPQTQQLLVTLANPGATDRADALRFIVHFVGDLHQPLHCATDVGPDPKKHTDLGGNLKDVCYFTSCTENGKPRNVHFTWDDYVIQRENPDEDAYVAKLQGSLAQMSGSAITALEQGTLVDWAEASHKLAVDHAYGDLPAPDASGVYQLADAYEAKANPIIDQQLLTAGIRLAHLLNTALDPGTAPPPVTPPAGGSDVFINRNGHSYHLATCRYVGAGSQKISLTDAKAMHRKACGVCKPPQ